MSESQKPKITLEEALKDYADNERDIRMFQHAVEGGWTDLHNPRLYLQPALDLREKIAGKIRELGGEVPGSPKELAGEIAQLREALARAEGALREITALADEWQSNRLGSADLQRRRWEFMAEIARKARAAQGKGRSVDHFFECTRCSWTGTRYANTKRCPECRSIVRRHGRKAPILTAQDEIKSLRERAERAESNTFRLVNFIRFAMRVGALSGERMGKQARELLESLSVLGNETKPTQSVVK